MTFQILLEFSSASILLFVGCYMIIIRNKKNIGVLYLGLFMGLLGIHYFYRLVAPVFPVLNTINEQLELLSLLMHLFCVLLFLFTYHYLWREKVFQKKTAWIFWLFAPPAITLMIENIYTLNLDDLRDFINLGLAIFIIVYNLSIIRTKKTQRLEASLLVHVNVSFLLMMIVWSLVLINRYISLVEESYVIYLFLAIQLYLVYGVVFYAMSNPFLFKSPSYGTNPMRPEQLINPNVQEEEKYRNSKLSQFEIKKLAKVISDEIDNNNLYLKPDLTMDEVGERLDLSPRVVSQVINTTFESNFSEFVNSYRIDHAKGLLSKSDKELSIKEIMYMSGFNSKSNFYGLFKRKIGMTPSSYRKERKDVSRSY